MGGKLQKWKFFQVRVSFIYKPLICYRIADVGCCFGTDTRKLLLDGVHSEDIYAVDIHDGFAAVEKRQFY